MTLELWSFSSALGSDAADLRDMSVEAVDGSIGKVKDAVDQTGGAYLIVDTGPWIFGKTVTLPAGVVTAVDRERRCVFIDRSKEDVKNAPEHDPDAPEAHHRDALAAYYGAGRERSGIGGSSAAEAPQLDASPASSTESGSRGVDGLPSESLGSERDMTAMTPGGGLEAAPQATGTSASLREHEAPADSPQTAGVKVPSPDSASSRLSSELTSPETEAAEPAVTHEASTDLAEEESGRTEDAPAQRRFARDSGPRTSEPTSKSRSGRSGGSGTSSASSDDMPITRYDALTAAQVIARLRNLSQRELAAVARYEKRHADRRTILDRIDSLQEKEPWRGYDDETVDEIKKKLADADNGRSKAVRDYERRHRARKGVIEAARRTLATA